MNNTDRQSLERPPQIEPPKVETPAPGKDEMKWRLLQKYAGKDVNQFIQIDFFCAGDVGPHYSTSGGSTFELMTGADVRVFVRPSITNTDAIIALMEIAMRIVQNGLPKPQDNFPLPSNMPEELPF